MATKKTGAASETEAKAVGKKIPIENLRRSCGKLFDVTPSTFDGATVGLSGKYTVEEMKAIIKGWLEKEVK